MTIKNASKWMSVLSAAFILAACGNGDDNGADETDNGDDNGEEIIDDENGDDEAGDDENDDEPAGDALEGAINPVTRESGSGTRDAFEDVFGLEEGQLDMFTTQQGQSAVMENVSGDTNAIGYSSIGALNDTVKALSVDGVEPTSENIADGDYEVFRTFNVMYGEELSDVAQDFWDFIFSADGQGVAEEAGYVPAADDAPEYEAPEGLSGDVEVGGSTSVAPVMESVAEAYMELNPDVTITVQATGSGAGITGAQDGSLDLGMASRDLEDEELEELIEGETMVIDGLSIIVNPDNPMDDISLDTVTGIFTGEITDWSEVE